MAASDLELNLQRAENAIRYVRSFLRYGSNTRKDSLMPEWQPARLQMMRDEVHMKAELHALENNGIADFPAISKLTKKGMKKYQFGNCGEQAQTAFVFLKKKGVCNLDFCSTSIGGHNLVVIGRESGSNPEDISTWGDSAVICDPWAERAYPLSDFKEMQKPENDIRYADICYEYGSPKPYLSGNLVSIFREENSFDRQKDRGNDYKDGLSIFGKKKTLVGEKAPLLNNDDKEQRTKNKLLLMSDIVI